VACIVWESGKQDGVLWKGGRHAVFPFLSSFNNRVDLTNFIQSKVWGMRQVKEHNTWEAHDSGMEDKFHALDAALGLKWQGSVRFLVWITDDRCGTDSNSQPSKSAAPWLKDYAASLMCRVNALGVQLLLASPLPFKDIQWWRLLERAYRVGDGRMLQCHLQFLSNTLARRLALAFRHPEDVVPAYQPSRRRLIISVELGHVMSEPGKVSKVIGVGAKGKMALASDMMATAIHAVSFDSAEEQKRDGSSCSETHAAQVKVESRSRLVRPYSVALALSGHTPRPSASG